MKTSILFITPLVCLTLYGCKPTAKQTQTTASVTQSPETSNVKELPYYKDVFMNAALKKADNLLGQPDKQDESPDGNNGYYIYYDKVRDKGIVKHLVIAYHLGEIQEIKAIYDGNTAYLNAGDVFIKKPNDFSSQNENTDSKLYNIDRAYHQIDTNRLQPQVIVDRGSKVKFYEYNNITLLKKVLPLSDNSYQTTDMLFINGIFQFQFERDNNNHFYEKKIYVDVNNKVIKYFVGDTDTPCEKAEYCRYDEYSTPYFLLKKFNSTIANDEGPIDR